MYNPMQAMPIVTCCVVVLLGGCSKGLQRAEPALPETQAHEPKEEQPNPTEVVRTAFEKARREEGKYFDHVWRILETPGGVQALIAELDSTNVQYASQAWIILSRISQRRDRHAADEEPRDRAHWEKWWADTGQTMSIQVMKSNFDSHWK